MTAVHQTIESLKHKAQHTDTRAARELTAAAGKALAKQQVATSKALAEQQKELKSLQRELAQLKAARSSGGFPWGLALVAGSAYALYRSNPAVRAQVQGLMEPGGVQDLLEKVKSPEFIAQVKTAVQSKLGGIQVQGEQSGAAGEESAAQSRTVQIEKIDHDLTSADISSAREAGQQGNGHQDSRPS